MTYSIKLLALVVLLFAGAWGWGWGAVRLLRRAGWKTALDELGPPMRVLLGVGLFLAFGGLLVAFDGAIFPVLFAWHLAGMALLVGQLWPSLRARPAGTRLSLPNRLALIAVGVFLTVVTLGIAIGVGFYNANDDNAGYIYLARRLLNTGGLIDPFNFRRLTGYGGSTLYQSMFMQVSGNGSLRGFELIFASLLLVLVAVGTTKRRWLVGGSLLLGAGVILGNGVGQVLNLSPNFSITALSLGVLQALRLVRHSSEEDQPLVYVVLGILLSGVLALRFSFLLSVGLAVLVVVVALRGRQAIKALIVLGLTMLACSGGWAIAMFRSSGTPLFPIISGNYNQTWPTGADPSEFAHGAGTFLHFVGLVFNTSNIGWVALASIVLGLTLLRRSQGRSKEFLVLASAGTGCLVQLAAYSYSFSGSFSLDVVRLVAPSTFACGLFALGLFWPDRAVEGSSNPDTPLATMRRGGSGLHIGGHTRRWGLASTAPIVVLLLAGAGLLFCQSIGGFASSIRANVALGVDVLDSTHPAINEFLLVEEEYLIMNSMIPHGARVLAAVNDPSLLSFSDYSFATLDVVGAASPSPHMPYFQGALAKVRYLRSLGFQYIVVDSPNNPGLYDVDSWNRNLRSNVFAYRQWTPYFVDWQSTVGFLEKSHRFQVRRTGSLALIRIG